MSIELLGFIAGILTAISLLPQLIKTLKTHSTHDVSLQWVTINSLGQLLWIIYGVIVNSVSLYVTSVLSLIMAVMLIIMKLKFK